ncbi:MAG: DUF1592 domain-containing protein, partial [Planctomycetota bacterium]
MISQPFIVRVFLGVVFAFLCMDCWAQVLPTQTALMDQHCFACHDSETRDGNLDLVKFAKQPVTIESLETWGKIHDRVQAGEMPPAEEARPRESEVKQFLDSTSEQIIAFEKRLLAGTGRAQKRRLNRYEYENSLRDLLSLPELRVKGSLPEDRKAHGYNKTGEALDVSHVQLSRYLRTAENALRQAIVTQAEKPERRQRRYYAWDQLKFTRGNGPSIRKTYPVQGYELRADLNVRPLGKPGMFIRPLPGDHSDPARREDEAVVMLMSTYEHQEIQFDQFRAPFSGRYRLKLAGYTVWMSPDYSEVSKGRRPEPITIYSDSPPRALRRLGHFDFAPDRCVQELEVWLNEGETIRPDASRLVRSRPPQFQNPLQEEDGMPGVAFQWLEVDGPLFESWPTPGHKLLFGNLGMQDDHAASLPGAKPAAGSASVSSSHRQRDAYPPYERGTYTTEINELDVLDGIYNAHNQVPARQHVRMRSEQPQEDSERLLRNFLLRAYRRPVGEAEYARFYSLIHVALENGHEFSDAMIAGYTAVLCSPEFLYHHSAPGKLDGFALAERLSYFLWNSPPDNELGRLAATGELLQTETLKAQTDRMLDDPKSRRFVVAFLDYWLDLRNMTASDPDSELYPEYQLDDALVESMTKETQLFFQELIQGDLGIRNVVDSDFVLVNERLASLYEIDGVLGAGFRPVELPASSPRGGLMTQASVLKVTSNGTTTSPVTRGAWVMERLLGEKVPPPPPSVQAIESDIRGATTIREQLA